MRENAGQNNSKYGQFLRSVYLEDIFEFYYMVTKYSEAQPELFWGRGGFVQSGHFHKHSVKNR